MPKPTAMLKAEVKVTVKPKPSQPTKAASGEKSKPTKTESKLQPPKATSKEKPHLPKTDWKEKSYSTEKPEKAAKGKMKPKAAPKEPLKKGRTMSAENHARVQPPPPTPHLVDAPLTLLPPAATFDTLGLSKNTIEAFRAGDLKSALDAWTGIMDAGTSSSVTLEEFHILSEELVNVLTGPSKVLLRKLVFNDAEGFQVMRHMAIEAAAHDKWNGLYEFLLQLLSAGQPTLASVAWKDFMKRARQVQGRDASDLTSRDRAARVAARLNGDGMLPLILVQVAALTMLNEFDHNAVMMFFETTAGVRSDDFRRLDFLPIRRRIDNPHVPKGMYTQFLKNLDALTLCVMCYHPVALKMRIESFSNHNQGSLKHLYDRIMNASIGPGRLIVPVAADKQHYDVVPLPPSVWKAFIVAFARNGLGTHIMNLIDKDAPARYMRTPTTLLGRAMAELAKMNASSASRRLEARASVDDIWQRICERGADNDPAIMRDRLSALNSLHDEEAMMNYYLHAKQDLRTRRVVDGDAYIDPVYFSTLCFTNRLDLALAVLDDHQPSDTARGSSAYQSFLINALANSMPYASRRQLLLKIMQTKPAGVALRPGSWGRILAFFLEGGHNLDKTVADIAKRFPPGQSRNEWGPLTRAVLIAPDAASPLQLEAAVVLLEKYFVPDEMLTSMRLFSIWRPVVVRIAQSTVISGKERHALLERVMGCYPGREGHYPFLCMDIVHASLRRPTADGVPEALYWWKLVPSRVVRLSDYKSVIEHLVDHGYPQVAAEIIGQLKPGGKATSKLVEFAHSLGVKTGVLHGDAEPESTEDGDVEERETLEDKEERLADEEEGVDEE